MLLLLLLLTVVMVILSLLLPLPVLYFLFFIVITLNPVLAAFLPARSGVPRFVAVGCVLLDTCIVHNVYRSNSQRPSSTARAMTILS